MARTRRVDSSGPGLTRKGRGKGFSYHEEDGELVSDKATLQRVRALAIPPAWTDVWICPHPRGHIQATGYDQAGRKQYIYHSDWRASRDRAKFEEMLSFAKVLPKLRARLRSDLADPGLTERRVTACAVALLDLGLFRVGSERYEDENRSYGLTTIKRKHLEIRDGVAIFEYPSKSRQTAHHKIADEMVMPTLLALKRLGGTAERDLLVFKADGEWRDLDSDRVNAYLKAQGGADTSAKDFRTWNATVMAAWFLAAHSDQGASRTARKRIINLAIRETAEQLNNTPAVCRASYIDPRVFDRFDQGETIAPALKRLGGAAEPGEFADNDAIERAVVRLLS